MFLKDNTEQVLTIFVFNLQSSLCVKGIWCIIEMWYIQIVVNVK